MLEFPIMKTLPIDNITGVLADLARNPNQKPLILTVKGKPVAALLPAKHGDVESVSLSLNPEFIAFVERARVRHEIEGGISFEEMCRRLNLALPGERQAKSKSRKPTPRKQTKKHGSQVRSQQ